jgi:hypothetical protein
MSAGDHPEKVEIAGDLRDAKRKHIVMLRFKPIPLLSNKGDKLFNHGI